MDIQEIKTKLESAKTGDEIKQILCSVIDTPRISLKEDSELRSLLREYKEHLLEIKSQSREHIESNGKIPLKWA